MTRPSLYTGRLTAAVILIAAGLAGCSGGYYADDNVLRIGIGAEPAALDPYLVTGVSEHLVLTSLFEGLCTLNQHTLEVEPGVAESWEVSEDGLTYTFHINPEARWSNGDPVTAHDFVYGWKRHLTPALASEYSYMLWCLKNGEAYNKGEITDFSEVGVRAIDDLTLEVNLEHPAPYFPSMQIHYSWFPVHQATVEAYGAIDDRLNRWTLPGNMVSNGPYKLVDWRPDQIITTSRNEHYWDADALALDGIHFYPIDDLSTEEREFRSGLLHYTSSIPTTKIDAYRENDPEALIIAPYVGTYFYRFNTKREPFDDPRVRRALAMAIDKESIARDVLRDTVDPTTAFTPPGLAGYTAEAGIEYDPDEARQLLEEAGYPNGEGFRSVEILYNRSEDHQKIAEAIQYMWKEELNIDVTTNNQEWKVYLSSMTHLDYDICRSAWIADFMDPINYLECFETDGGNNRTGWSSAEFDALIDQARQEPDPGKRYELFQQAERIMMDEAPIAPIYSYTQRHLRAPEAASIVPNLIGYLNYRYFHLEPESAGER